MTSPEHSAPKRPPTQLDDPALTPFLPLLYVAWADGDLGPDEIRSICRRLEASDGLGGCRQRLGRWLDPGQPPTAAELQALLATIRRAAPALDPSERRTLTSLGLELARAGGVDVGAPERQALTEIETALGIVGTEATAELLTVGRPAAGVERRRRPLVDTAALHRVLEGDRAELREQLFGLLSTPEFAYQYGLPTAEYRERVLGWTRQLADAGFGGLGYPSEYGGGGDMPAFLAAFEALAYHDLSLLVKFGVQFGLFAGSIYQLGTERHHREFLPAALSLELPGCFAMTETGHGSNVFDLETTARFDPTNDEFVITTPTDSARKDYIGNAAAHARMATVFAQLLIGDDDHGVHAFLVPIRDGGGEALPGVRIGDDGHKLGLNGVDNGRLWFDGVRVPRTHLLDRFASVSAAGGYHSPIASRSKRFFTMLGTLVGGRVNLGLASLSATKSALTIAIRYGSGRRQFGPAGQPERTLLDYLTHQRRLLPPLATTYALHFALRELAREYVEGDPEDRRELEAEAAGLKAYATWHANRTIQTCREACGGQGYLAVNRFASLKADLDVFTTFEGDNTVLMQLLAKGLLTGYKRRFGEMGFGALVRYVGERAGVAIIELNPVVTRRRSADHLRDPDFQRGALEWRQDHLLGSLARRLKKRLDSGMDTFDALVECQDHAVKLAEAHVELTVWEAIQRAAGGAGSETRKGLALLRDLFALARVEADLAWFQEHGYVQAGKAKAIRRLVTRLCHDVREEALALVDAFGIPDAILAAPIGLSTGYEPGAD